MLEESTYFEELLEGVDKLQITLKGSKNEFEIIFSFFSNNTPL